MSAADASRDCAPTPPDPAEPPDGPLPELPVPDPAAIWRVLERELDEYSPQRRTQVLIQWLLINLALALVETGRAGRVGSLSREVTTGRRLAVEVLQRAVHIAGGPDSDPHAAADGDEEFRRLLDALFAFAPENTTAAHARTSLGRDLRVVILAPEPAVTPAPGAAAVGGPPLDAPADLKPDERFGGPPPAAPAPLPTGTKPGEGEKPPADLYADLRRFARAKLKG